MQSKIERHAQRAMESRGLHPIESLDWRHHTETEFTKEDEEVAELAYWLGGLFIDKEDYDSSTPLGDTYWYKEMNSVDVWKRVARALRIHGLKIVDA